MSDETMSAAQWLMGGDTGISSKTICAVMIGSAPPSCSDTPSDPDDFGRCYRLLQAFPKWKARMPEVAARHPKWGPMVEAWGELTAMYERVCDTEGRYTPASYAENKSVAGALYKRMRELNEAGYVADGWTGGNGSWTKARKKESA